jgi:hypothetical protein
MNAKAFLLSLILFDRGPSWLLGAGAPRGVGGWETGIG